MLTLALLLVPAAGLPAERSRSGLPPLERKSLPLSAPAESIWPGGGESVLAYSREAGGFELLNARTGEALSVDGFAGVPLSVVPVDDGRESGSFVVLSMPGSDPQAQLGRIAAGEDAVRYRPTEDAEIPAGFKAPQAQLKLPDFVVVWDSALDHDLFFYRVLGAKGPADFDIKPYPHRLLNIGSERVMLGLHPTDAQVTLTDVTGGYVEDAISVDGLAFGDPQRFAVFVPGAAYGGTGDVIVANADAGLLTVLSLTGGPLPRIGNPLQIAMPASQGGGPVLLAADRPLSWILVGARGSGRLEMFRRSGGAIDRLEPIELGFPIADMTVLQGPGSSDPDVLVLLHEDGRQISIVPDVAVLRGRGSDQVYTQSFSAGEEDGSAPVVLGDIARVQRVLAALGYKVGAIDGLEGPLTKAAIRAFQYNSGLEVTGRLDGRTLALLNESVAAIGQANPASDPQAAAYRAFLADVVPGVDAFRLLTLGAAHENPDHPCFGLNGLPPRVLWENSINLARILNLLEGEEDLQVQVTSAYRSPAYSSCINAPPAASSHVDFAAFDLRLATSPEKEEPRRLIDALRRIESRVDFRFDLHELATYFVHVGLEGSDGIVTRPTVYLQFAGGARGRAQELTRLLALDGFILPGEERLPAAAGKSEIRYFHTEDREAAEALKKSAAQALSELGYSAKREVTIVDLTDWSGEKPEPGVLELWVEL
jgi:hypothetical protein